MQRFARRGHLDLWPTLDGANIKILQVACGFGHTIVLDAAGKVYTFGLNQAEQLGSVSLLRQAFALVVDVSAWMLPQIM
jgi:alpha-tubulin suppressor-like RCC1 family protein